MRKAVGIHGFAGGFTMGVKKYFDVQCQLEQHNFGKESCEGVAGVPFINDVGANWPQVDAELAYGNPRCTAFSTITSGYGENYHGPCGKQTADIHSLIKYAIGKYDIVIFESVQQAFSTGKPLLDYIRDEHCKPKHYRIAHVLLSAAALGNSQNRRRYFFVAYRDDRNFNIEPPCLPTFYTTCWDVFWPLKDRVCQPMKYSDTDYTADSYRLLNERDQATIENLPNGWCFNNLGRYATHLMHPENQQVWNLRSSDMPFSMHCPYRLQWLRPMPTIFSTRSNLVHPLHHRCVTVGEIAATMGWPRIPIGKDPVSQMAKGLVPAAGEWIAKQAMYYLDDAWGADDWESTYNHHKGTWEGADAHGKLEKVLNLTHYIPHGFNLDRFPEEVRVPPYRRVKQ